MHVVTRTYAGQSGQKLVELLNENRAEIEPLLRAVPGFVSYIAAKIGNDGVSITVCNDKAGTDESMRVAREWVSKKASGIGVSAPQAAEGQALIVLK